MKKHILSKHVHVVGTQLARWLALMAVVIAMAMLGMAPIASANEEDAIDEDEHVTVITGRVLAAALPVAGAEVTLGGCMSETATADNAGVYRFTFDSGYDVCLDEPCDISLDDAPTGFLLPDSVTVVPLIGGVTTQDLVFVQGGQVRLSITNKKGHAFNPGSGDPVFWYVLAADANSDDSDGGAWRGRGPATVTTGFLSPGSYRVAARAYGGWRDPSSRIVTVTPGGRTAVRISITRRQLDVNARALKATKVDVSVYGPESGYRVQGQRLSGGRWTNKGKAAKMRGSDSRNIAVSGMTWSYDGYLTNYRFVVKVKGSAKTSIAFVHAMDLVADPWT